MDDSLPQRFFLQPTCPQQRRYEALRAVFVGGLSQKEAARRFGYSHGALRVLVRRFRAACAAGDPPPFSPGPAGGGPRPNRPARPRPDPTRRPSPTPAP
jgi:hypothetical protein